MQTGVIGSHLGRDREKFMRPDGHALAGREAGNAPLGADAHAALRAVERASPLAGPRRGDQEASQN